MFIQQEMIDALICEEAGHHGGQDLKAASDVGGKYDPLVFGI